MELLMTAQATAFLLALWWSGWAFEKLRLSALVGEILIGIALGPGCLGLVPESVGFVLLGKIGIFWLLFDGGAHLELGTLRETGLVSIIIALTGVIVPLASVWLAMKLVGFTLLQGFVMGTALAPTSGGMAVKLMSDAGVLSTKVGQTIVCAAMTDDIFSLVILAIVTNLDGGESAGEEKTQSALALEVCLPIVSSLCFILLAFGISYVTPKIFNGRSYTLVGPAMVILSVALALACKVTHSSEYMGAFLAGVCFADVYVDPEEQTTTDGEMEDAGPGSDAATGRLQQMEDAAPGSDAARSRLEQVPVWLERRSPASLESFFVSIFFASTGFNVPAKKLLNPHTMLLGALCSAVAMAGKLVSGVWAPPGARWTVGWAMVARGELGFVMASSALKSGLTPSIAFNVTVWAVLTNTLISPPIFQKLLQSMGSKEKGGEVYEKTSCMVVLEETQEQPSTSPAI